MTNKEKISVYSVTTLPTAIALPLLIKLDDESQTFKFPISPTFPLEPNPKMVEFSLQNTILIYR